MMQKIILPIIRKISPESIASEICSVQPMSGEHAKLFTMRSPAGNLRGVVNIEDDPKRDMFGRIPKEGDSIHSFFDGWLIYYGTKYIPVDIWWKIKIAGLGNYKSNLDT